MNRFKWKRLSLVAVWDQVVLFFTSTVHPVASKSERATLLFQVFVVRQLEKPVTHLRSAHVKKQHERC